MPSVSLWEHPSYQRLFERDIGVGLGETLNDSIQSLPDIIMGDTSSADIPAAIRKGFIQGYAAGAGHSIYEFRFYVGSLAHFYLFKSDPTEGLTKLLDELPRLKKVRRVMEA